MKPLLRRSAAALLLVATVTAGCSSDSPSSPTTEATTGTISAVSREEAAAAITAEVIIPAYAAADAAVGELSEAVVTLCATPADSTALAEARDAWRGARLAWAATRAFRFGPVMDLRSMSKVDFPVDPEKVDALVAGSGPLDPESIAGLGADQRGLGAVEIVLFADDTVTARECEFAQSAVALVEEATGAVVAGWEADPVTDSKTFIDGAVNGLIFALVDVGDQRLGKASGDLSGVPEFAEVDSGLAQTSLLEIDAILAGGSDVLDAGLLAAVSSISPDAASRLRAAEYDAAIAAVAAVPGTIATTTDTAPLSAAYQAVLVPLRTLRTEVASLLGVTLTLGDADGDS